MRSHLPLRKLSITALAGSCVFWLPFLLSSLFSNDWGISAVLELSIGVPLLMCFATEIVSDLWQISRRLTAVFILTGVWLSGPIWITLQDTFTPGEGFHMAGAWVAVAWETLLFPVTTFMMATYHGSLSALLITVPAVVCFALTEFRFFNLQRLSKIT